MAQLLGVLEQGLIYAVLALGVYITFKILDFPDMTVDSSFPLGAAVTALMISNGVNPLLTLPASLLAGAADFDALCAVSGLESDELGALLIEMEMDGLVTPLAGTRYAPGTQMTG